MNWALQTLKRYPVKLSSGKECKILENFGDKICGKLDTKLKEYTARYGTTDPVEGYLTVPMGNHAKKRRTIIKTTNSGFDDLNFDSNAGGSRCSIDISAAAHPVQLVRSPHSTGNQNRREYIPQYRSGAYALLITLFRHQQLGGTHLNKKNLMEQAQSLADKSFTIPDSGSRYTAWSSMGLLIIKGLIVKQNNPAKYYMTDTGCVLAARLLDGNKDNQFSPSANSVSSQLSFCEGTKAAPTTMGNPTTTSARATMGNNPTATSARATMGNNPTATSARATMGNNPTATSARATMGNNPTATSARATMGNNPTATSARATMGNNPTAAVIDDDAMIINKPLYDQKEETFPMMFDEGLIESDEDDDIRLQFHYVDESGNEVNEKDMAAVTIDDDGRVGFLVKCQYEDLLMSGRRYKLDTTRHTLGDDIFAYIPDEGAPEMSTSAQKLLKKDQQKPQTVTSSLTALTKDTQLVKNNSYLFQPTASQSSIDSMTSNAVAMPVIPSHGDVTKMDIDRPAINFHCKTKIKQKLANIATKPLVQVPLKRSEPDLFCLPDLPSSINSQSVPSISGDSQSQDSTSAGRSIEISEAEFVLRPGSFEIILCVDNQEFYGGGNDARKQIIVKELERNKVPHDIRSLHIGDFCWVARSKTGGCELVLDYIIERKRMDDLAGSIIDGRFKEQKFRLKHCGLHHLMYLVENHGSNQHFSIGEDALCQAITNTQVVDNFYVKRTSDNRESASYLTVMTRYLQSLHANKTLCAVSKAQLTHSQTDTDDLLKNQEIYLMKFDEFNEGSVKTKTLTVKDMFVKQLCQLHGLTVEKAVAILERYPTPTRLIKAYRACITEKEREILLASIKFGSAQKSIGAAISKVVYYLYNTTEGTAR